MIRALLAVAAATVASAGVRGALPLAALKAGAIPNNSSVVRLGSIDQGCFNSPITAAFEATTNVSNPKIGDWVGITFTFTLNDGVTVSGGVVHLNSIVNGFIPYNVDDDLAKDATDGGAPLPWTGGTQYTVQGAVEMPSGVSSITVKDEWVDQDGNQIMCATIKATF